MKNTNILIVEDDEVTRLMMVGALEEEGYEAKSCESAEEAWDYLQLHQPELVFLDINLPGMNGLELCKKIREEKKDETLYIIAATGKDSPEDLQEILEAGANDYMPKPLHPKILNIRARIAEYTIHKIKENQEFKEKLSQSEERYRIISENGRDAVITIKEDGTMTYISPGTENLIGFRVAGLLGKKIQEFIHKEDEKSALPHGQDEMLNGNLEEITEFRMKNSDGGYIWVEALHRPLQNKEGSGIQEWISYIREAQSIKDMEHKTEALENILDGHNLQSSKILERIATVFNGKAILLLEERTENTTYRVLIETGDKEDNTEKILKLLWQGAIEEQRVTNMGQTRLQPYIIPNGLQTLAHIPETTDMHKWESGMIQPLPTHEDHPEKQFKLVILSMNTIQDRESRATRAILKLAGGILGLKKTHDFN